MTSRPALPTVLVADAPAGVATLENVLHGHARIVGTNATAEALSLMKGGVDLVVCGVHFDDSRMFDLLRLAKADPQTRALPFACFRDMQSELSDFLLQGLDIACSALGSDLFVDLLSLKKRHGIEEADAQFRRLLLRLLEPGSP
jgi:CheY-like chemotaxis protein